MGRQGNRNERNEREGIGMRVMAIDYGDARTGVAISDATGMLAGFTTVIHGRDSQRVLEEIEELIAAHGVDELVMGFPRNKERCGMPVSLWDERRTTIEAHQILHASGKRMKNHKKNVDAVAATLILEGYLARKRLARS